MIYIVEFQAKQKELYIETLQKELYIETLSQKVTKGLWYRDLTLKELSIFSKQETREDGQITGSRGTLRISRKDSHQALADFQTRAILNVHYHKV